MASILETSPDGDPRRAAAEALAAYDAGLGIGFSTATYYLLQALCNDPSPTVKQVACRSLLTTLGHPDQIPTDFHPDRIDWDLINHLIPPTPESTWPEGQEPPA